MRREAFKFWDLVRLILETLRYVSILSSNLSCCSGWVKLCFGHYFPKKINPTEQCGSLQSDWRTSTSNNLYLYLYFGMVICGLGLHSNNHYVVNVGTYKSGLWYDIYQSGICQCHSGYSKTIIYSFVYTSGHCLRWRWRMEVKIVDGSLFVHCKIA